MRRHFCSLRQIIEAVLHQIDRPLPYASIQSTYRAPSHLQFKKLAYPNWHKTLLTKTMDRRKLVSDALAAERALNCNPVQII